MESFNESMWVRRAIGHHVGSLPYLNCMTSGSARFDLQGMPCGLVTEQEEAQAKETRRQRQKKMADLEKQKKLSDVARKNTANESQSKIELPVNPPLPTSDRKILTLKKRVPTRVAEPAS